MYTKLENKEFTVYTGFAVKQNALGKAGITAYFHLYILMVEPQGFPYHLPVEPWLFLHCTLAMLVRRESIVCILIS